MDFFIKKGNTLPILLMDVIKDGRTDSYLKFYNELDNANIRFSMKNEDNGIQKIYMERAYIVSKIKNNPDSNTEYYIFYKWRKKDTNKKGRYVGEFSIILETGELIAPITENLYINII